MLLIVLVTINIVFSVSVNESEFLAIMTGDT